LVGHLEREPSFTLAALHLDRERLSIAKRSWFGSRPRTLLMLKVAIFMIRSSATTGGAMSTLQFVVLIVAATAVSNAAGVRAQDLPFQPTPEQRAACETDYNKFCLGMIPGGGRIIACLDRQHDQLGESCRKLVDASKASKKE
jgi:hypothetical protein